VNCITGREHRSQPAARPCCRLSDFRPPQVSNLQPPLTVRALIKRDLNSRVLKGVTKHRKEFDRAFRMSANHYGEMMLRRNLMIARWEHFFADSDFLICPVAFGPAYPRTQVGTRLSYDGTDMVYADYVWPSWPASTRQDIPRCRSRSGLARKACRWESRSWVHIGASQS
jgi:Asp-tRNA(Asn)/Glu-tRNA(Gln) amidotransferase A subunit family amidase